MKQFVHAPTLIWSTPYTQNEIVCVAPCMMYLQLRDQYIKPPPLHHKRRQELDSNITDCTSKRKKNSVGSTSSTFTIKLLQNVEPTAEEQKQRQQNRRYTRHFLEAVDETYFKVENNTQMGVVFDAYARGKGEGATASDFCFSLDAQRICNDETPGSLDLEDQDQIDVRKKRRNEAGKGRSR